MPRELTSHKVNGCNEQIRIVVVDEPGDGGACHEYHLDYPTKLTDEAIARGVLRSGATQVVSFQNGPIKESGVNGITHEALLAILEDRLTGFQSGKFACQANADALAHVQAAQRILKDRTSDRLVRGVEGTHQK